MGPMQLLTLRLDRWLRIVGRGTASVVRHLARWPRHLGLPDPWVRDSLQLCGQGS